MPIIPVVLTELLKAEIDAAVTEFAASGPLSQTDPSHFIILCTAVAAGLAEGTPTILFTTDDTGLSGVPPVPGAGVGVGVVVDDVDMASRVYTKVRTHAAIFGETTHSPWPPPAGDSGKYLEAFCLGFGRAIKSHFATTWALVGTHPTIYSGTGVIPAGNFAGVVAANNWAKILQAGAAILGPGWPFLALAISEGFTEGILELATGAVTITGACVPSISQVCAVPSTGAGSGVAG